MKKIPASPSKKKLHVFIADGETADVPFFKSSMEELAEEVKVTVAQDVRELLAFLELVVPDIIFLNVNFRSESGEDCLTTLRQQTVLDKIPVLVYSDQASKEAVYRSYILGANLYISKPRYFQSLKKDLLQKLSARINFLVPQPSINDYVLNLGE
jgi:PleD family two-component response regulator